MTNFAEKIRPRIVFDLTIHREIFYRVDLINLTFHFDINFFTYNYTRAFFCRSKHDISMRILLPGNLTKKTAVARVIFSGSFLSLIAR
jgi:hypothetical protein